METLPIYDGFENWQDVAVNFNTGYAWDDEAKAAALIKIPEPEEVIIAADNQEGYEGDAWIVYRNGEKYYEVEGSHCSCMGFEGQFDPQEYENAELLLAALEKRDYNYGAREKYNEAVKLILKDRI